ncbi:ribonuclease Z [Desulfosporosinus nitroreducens]|uniref:Ribonuclease Z n=1 Tax=Desulfosporosinus nitroreducens TaxID=2018668 RepID=A0ABT8QPG8_9FIRM|nr:ribonuclease Z [Desulfosporosinus nitroreducens]MCO1602126.1 ribonuclease Z [Desulfosporosinus nitroreducens]MDO0823253.1 ribonuclease Z [Desulfosporosinus nitroreducens]
MLNVCLLGTGGMMPLPNRWLTSLLIKYNGRMLLIDCGEGTQIPLKMVKWGFKSIDAILFTHYHADHIAGLPGLLLTIGNAGRKEPLTLMGPPGIKKAVEGLTVISPELPYELTLIELSDLESTKTLLSNIEIKSIPVDHTLPCLSYSIELKRQGEFDVERAKELSIPVSYWNSLQKGMNITFEGKIVSPQMVIGETRKGIKVSYCTDTRPTEGLIEFIKDSDLFICEGMYGNEDDLCKAEQKKHMMFSEAGLLAKQGSVKELWLTHYSPSLTKPEEYIEPVRTIFKNTIAGSDLLIKSIKYTD